MWASWVQTYWNCLLFSKKPENRKLSHPLSENGWLSEFYNKVCWRTQKSTLLDWMTFRYQ